MSRASAITTQWKGEGFHLHLLYFKQFHHVAGNRSLLLQRASNSPQEHCGPYECVPHTTHAAAHARDLMNQVWNSTYLLSLIKSIISCSIFKRIILSLSKRNARICTIKLWAEILEENIHITVFTRLFCKNCQSSWLKLRHGVFFTLDHLQKTKACFSAPSLTYRFHSSMSSAMVWEHFQPQQAAINALHRKTHTAVDSFGLFSTFFDGKWDFHLSQIFHKKSW